MNIQDEITKEFNNMIEKQCEGMNKVAEIYYKLGQSQIIAHVLHCINVHNFNQTDIKKFLYDTMESDKNIKDYTYEVMKDLKPIIKE